MNYYLLFKSLHLISVISWMAGLLYLPRLFVYHAMSDDKISIDRFKVMERKLFYGIMTPGALLTIVFGLCTLFSNGLSAYSGQLWLHVKYILILILIGYHAYCFLLLQDFKHNRNKHSHIWYRWYNEIPVVIMIAIIILAVVRPF